MPYERLIDTICSLELPVTLEQQTIDQIQKVKRFVKNIVTKEPLTGTLNALEQSGIWKKRSFKV